ncbi:hypothetical protein [Arthrobacter sp. NA-172]|uniref:hypothetical protein n=1 Tax=Arthrobacter sp. NA-172 TaxID=3367524 RepID=UPI003753F0ED
MKKFTATLLMTGLLAIGGFVTPANAAPKTPHVPISTTVTTVPVTTDPVHYAQIGWWPN